MATRTNHHTAPILDDGYDDSSAAYRGEMTTQQYNNAIKMIRFGSGNLEAIEAAGLAACTRLGLVPTSDHDVETTPSGTKNIDAMSIIDWMGKVKTTDEAAKAQVRAITATCTAVIAARAV